MRSWKYQVSNVQQEPETKMWKVCGNNNTLWKVENPTHVFTPGLQDFCQEQEQEQDTRTT